MMRTERASILYGRRGERGSTLLVVLALLAVLVLATLTIAFTSRVEITSVDNFNRALQNRVGGLGANNTTAQLLLTELPAGPTGRVQLALDGRFTAVDAESSALGELATLTEEWKGASKALLFSVTDKKTSSEEEGEQVTSRLAELPIPSLGPVQTRVGAVTVSDASGLINLNTADAETLERLITVVAERNNIGSVNARGIADSIVSYRRGGDSAPGTNNVGDDEFRQTRSLAASHRRERDAASYTSGSRGNSSQNNSSNNASAPMGVTSIFQSINDRREMLMQLIHGITEQDVYTADIRLPAFGDDRRFQSVGELTTRLRINPRLVAALEPHLTVFSISTSEAIAADGTVIKPLDINRASVDEIYEALRALYGEKKDPDLLLQFALNVVDSRDLDNVPTMKVSEKSGKTLLGIERTPVITEVYPDSIGEDRYGDNGEFIELFNPWQEAINLYGWRISTGSGTYTLPAITIAPAGYVIITDDFDNSRDPYAEDEPRGTGSFYDIFALTDNGTTRRIVVLPTLDIPHQMGSHKVELKDKESNVVDSFEYRITRKMPTLGSFQRTNIFAREATIETATPFRIPAQPDGSQTVQAAMATLPLNTPFVSTAELLEIVAFAPGQPNNPLRFPVPGAARYGGEDLATAADDYYRLDARLLDLFVVEGLERQDRLAIAKHQRRQQPAAAEDDATLPITLVAAGRNSEFETIPTADVVKAAHRHHERPIGLLHGRVNVNTATPEALYAVGFEPNEVATILFRRMEAERAALLGTDPDGIAYRSLAELWGDEAIFPQEMSRTARLRRIARLNERLTVNSRAFLLEGRAVEERVKQEPRLAGTTVRTLVALDGTAPEVVRWQIAP